MFTLARSIAGFVAACFLLSCSLASAAVYRVDFSGTIVEGADTGRFGPAGSLAGDAFVASYRYDSDFLSAIPGVGAHVEPVSASLTVNGATYYFPTFGFIQSFGEATPGALRFQFINFVSDADPFDIEAINNSATSPLISPSLAFDADAVIPVHGSGDFDIGLCCCLHCGPGFVDVFSRGSFDITSVHLFSPASGPVPEPTTWALMILGFSLVGSALRRRALPRDRRGGGQGNRPAARLARVRASHP